MYENMYNNGYYYAPGAMQYAQNFARPQMTQPLTPEEMAILKDKGGGFTTKVTKEDMFKAYCTHKQNGAIVAFQNQDGSFTCPICGETFEARSLDKESLEADVKAVLDDIQMIKLSYLDIPVEVARQYFPIVPLIEKIPQLGTIAANNFAKYEAGAATTQGNTPYGFAAYNTMMLGGGMMPGYGMQMPMYPQNMQPMQGQQPMYNNQQPMVDPNAMVNPMNPTGGYPMYQPNMMPQQAGMMTAPVNPMVGNEFGSYGTVPGYSAQPQVQAPVVAQQAQPQAQQPVQAAAPVAAPQAAQTPSVDVSSFQI